MSSDGKNLFLGIDIGTGSIKIALLSKEKNGQIRLVKSAYEEYAGSQESAFQTQEEILSYFLKKFLRKVKYLHNTKIGLAIAGQSAFVRLIKIPVTAPKKLHQIVLYETQQQVPFPIKDVVWDYQIYGKDKKDLYVLLAAVKKELIISVLAVMDELALEVEFVDVSNLALFNFLQYFYREINQTLVLDCGAKTTNILIVNGGRVWTRSLPIGGEDITEAISKVLKIDRSKAEELKKDKGKVLMLYYGQKSFSSPEEHKIFEIVTGVFTDLTNEIVKTLNFYKSQHAFDINFRRVLLTGGVSKTQNIAPFFENSLAVPVEKLDCFSFINFDAGVEKEISEFLCPAIGLALRGYGRSILNINLLSPERLQLRNFKKKVPFIVGSCALMLLSFLVISIIMWNKYNISKNYMKTLERSAVEYESTQGELEKIKTKISGQDAELSAMAQTLSGKYAAGFVLSLISDSLPDSICLSKVNFDLPALKLLLSGVCRQNLDDIEAFQQRLNKQPMISSVKIDTIGKSEKGTITFSFTVLLEPSKTN